MTISANPTASPPPRGLRSRYVPLALGVIVIGAATLLLRVAPIFDAGVPELSGRLTRVRQELLAAEREPGRWAEVSGTARAELSRIADDARRSSLRLTGLWSAIVRVDRREIAALKEIQRLAETDIPALIASGPRGNDLRTRAVEEGLGRVDDHLAGASPYLPPIRPIENQEGLARKAPAARGWSNWLVVVGVVDVLLLAIAGVWWLGLRGKSSTAST